jgi:hypothetical protein
MRRIYVLNAVDSASIDDFKLINNIDEFWVLTIDASKVDITCYANSLNPTSKQFKVRAQTNQCSINMPIELIPGGTRNRVFPGTKIT